MRLEPLTLFIAAAIGIVAVIIVRAIFEWRIFDRTGKDDDDDRSS